MKKLLFLICLFALSVTAMFAQPGKYSVEAADIKLVRTDEYVTVSFTLNAGRKAVKADYNLIVNPVLRNGENRKQLPSIVVHGKRSKVADARHELATGERHYEQQPLYMHIGTSLDYTATFPYESWMRGGEMLLEGVSVGCCSSMEVNLGLIAENVLYHEPVFETQIVEVPVEIPRRQTTGEHLAEQYSFIAPVKELAQIVPDYLTPNPNMSDNVEHIITETRQGSISIYFRQGLHKIDRNLGDNNKNLVELISAVRTLAAAEDSRIIKVVIAGFASPEGSQSFNDRLAHNRAVAVKEFLVSNSDVDPATIQIYNGGVDWAGLRVLIERSDIYRKWRILDIIDNVPVWDGRKKVGRLGQIMQLDSGRTYKELLRDFFPQLRQAAYIKVYFDQQ